MLTVLQLVKNERALLIEQVEFAFFVLLQKQTVLNFYIKIFHYFYQQYLKLLKMTLMILVLKLFFFKRIMVVKDLSQFAP